ncbi:MAG TPA: TetR/AcrR family transcriptional regulator C-terminal domain-containing protein [Lysobacter sp.]
MLDLPARRRTDGPARAPVAPARSEVDLDALYVDAIGIDANGSPVSIPPAAWLVCFVPGLRRQWWHRFAHARHKHVFALRPLGDGTWLLVEPWWTRMMVNVLTLDEAVRFLRWGAMGDILQVRESIPGRGSQLRGWSNCSVLVSFLLGRSYWTWTPNGLYRKLRDEPGVESVDLARFLRAHFLEESIRHATTALRTIPTRAQARLQDVLLELGIAVVTAMMSSSAIGLHKVAVSESRRFSDAATAFWTAGPQQAVGRIRKVLAEARRRGEVELRDCDIAARHLLAMLRGNLHMEVSLGLRPMPCVAEVRDHVAFVVSLFLHGAAPARWPDAPRDDAPGLARATDLPVAHGLIREVGESVREIVRGDDWESVAGWAEMVWSDYVACTGLTWEQVSGRIRRAWEACGETA